MNLDDIVPPLELCKLIPAGEFEDSTGIWVYFPKGDKKFHLYLREDFDWSKSENYPAPTLQEILEKIAEIKGVLNPTVFQQLTGWVADCAYDPTGEITEADEQTDDVINRLEIKDCRDKKPATAALKLWLKIKGIEII